jgi:hypothetical protein
LRQRAAVRLHLTGNDDCDYCSGGVADKWGAKSPRAPEDLRALSLRLAVRRLPMRITLVVARQPRREERGDHAIAFRVGMEPIVR